MTEFDLLEYIGEADDRYVMEARRRPKKPKWPAALAACLLAAVIGGAAIWRAGFAGKDAEETVQASPAASVSAAPSEASPAESASSDVPSAAPSAGEYAVTVLSEAAVPDDSASGEAWKDNQVTDDTRAALDAFAYRTAAAILPGQNGCYSPLSLYQALAMLASGSGGQTQEELLGLLGQGDLDTLADQAGKLYRVNNQDDETDRLKIANSLWLGEKAADGSPVGFHQDWVMNAAQNYYASVYQADFSDAGTGKAMGQWIADQTGGLLAPTLDPSQDTVMSLISTVWYKSQWLSKFEDGGDGTFTAEDGQSVPCQMMTRSDDEGAYCRGDGYTKSELGLSAGWMIVVLPDEGVDVDSFLTEEKLWEIFETGEFESAKVNWTVPKFEADVTFDLAKTLADLGIPTAFSTDADFSAIADTPLYVSGAQQGTHIALTVDGIEAAAYTDIGMGMASAPLEGLETVEMNLSRPFLYLITASNGTPLFLGVVRTPA